MASVEYDDEEMVQCPYNPAHTMLRKRLIPHLAKCRISYPDVDLMKCPFNAGHMIPEPEFRHHAQTCPDRLNVNSYKYSVQVEKPDVKITPQEKVDCDDDWDDVDVETYKPHKYASQAPIIRNANSYLPSEKKHFRDAEKQRHHEMDLSD